MSTLHVTEQYGNRAGTKRDWHLTPNRQIRPLTTQSESKLNLKNLFCDIFLPQGYPDSVTDDYLEYQLWDTLQAFVSSITGTLATEAVLRGVGVGDETATPLAATITWLLKDGTGHVGRIAFAWARGTQLDSDCKKWRLFADVLNDVSFFLDLLAPYFRPLFTYIVCLSSLCRSIVGVAGGATRAALTQHQARRNNLADVSAKDGSQETLVNLSALICSLVLLPVVSGKMVLIWTLFCVLTVLHILANYKAVKALRMDIINRKRLQILIRHWHKYGEILDIRSTNEQEPIFMDFLTNLTPSLRFGCSLQEIEAHKMDENTLKKLKTNLFLICNSKSSIQVLLSKGGGMDHMLSAAYFASLAAENGNVGIFEPSEMEWKSLEAFHSALKTSPWRTDHFQLDFDEWRYEIDQALY